MLKTLIITSVVVLALIGAGITLKDFPKPSLKEPFKEIAKNTQKEETKTPENIIVIAKGLEVPWALAFLPDKSILITERKGIVRLIKDGVLVANPIAKINVKQTGESGLHGIAIDPKFNENFFVYLYYTYSDNGNNTLNRVSRFTYSNETLESEKIIVDKIPGAIFHDGGRLKFGPDGYLYITTGDAGNPSQSQNKNSLAGKVLRIVNDKIEVYSYGHRNPQGIAWDNKGNLWESEHGNSATDEINFIEQGKNYGWPTIKGDENQTGLISPRLHSGTNTWAPAGLAYVNGSLYFGGLRGTALFQYNPETKELKEHFKGEYCRIRDVVVGPDSMLYITTSNKDGRGKPGVDDDKIIQINPSSL